MKSSIVVFFLTALLVACSAPESPTPSGRTATPVTGVSLDKSQLNFVAGSGSTGLVATVLPANATNQGVAWSSSNITVATVDQKGLVTPQSPGTATITVTTADGGKAASCVVKVTSATVAVTGVSLNTTTLVLSTTSLATGLIATVAPTTATNLNVNWASSDPTVATVSAAGLVTSLKVGTTTITVTTADGGKTASCVVNVTTTPVAVTGVSLDRNQLNFVVGSGSVGLVAAVLPANATNQEVAWSSNNTNVVTVDQKGVVTPQAPGTTSITVTTADGGKTASCIVKVTSAPVAVTGVNLDKSQLNFIVGSVSAGLVATVLPANATNQEVAWSSDNTNVATVDQKGVVTPQAKGTTTIRVTTADGGKTVSCTVTVSLPVSVSSVSLDQFKVDLMVSGAAGQLVATVLPSDAADKAVTWASSNPLIANVDASGKLNPVRAGTVTVTATTHDGGKTATSRVAVHPAWTWMAGASVPTWNSTPNYGLKGVGNAENDPGTRVNAVSGTDASGNLWVFGGKTSRNGTGGTLNDVWRLSTTGLWTWMSGKSTMDSPGTYGTTGVSDTANSPGSTYGASGWFLKGSLWSRGGYEFDDGSFVFNNVPQLSSAWADQLWQYSTSGAWTFWEGSTNLWNFPTPAESPTVMGPRSGSATWTDGVDKAWLFGGSYYANATFNGTYNDLWEFVPATKSWTKLSGTLTANVTGVYGTKNVAAATNIPGAREGAVTWIDDQGRLWLFGGYGFGAEGSTEGTLNDLWRFDPATRWWTWVSGSTTVNHPGSWSVGRGIPDPSNVPPGLSYAHAWTDDLGQLWLFGGANYQRNAQLSNFLWLFDGVNWTLMGGDGYIAFNGTEYANNGVGSFGTQGVTAATNYPPARYGAAVGGSGSTRWVYGGQVHNDSSLGYGNDVWKVQLK